MNPFDILKAHYNSEDSLDEPEGFEIEEEGEWIQDGKYQYTTTILKHIESGRCFELYFTRSGSYHSDYYYDVPEVGREVKKVTRMVEQTVWEKV